MKTILILGVLVTATAWAVEKNADLRQGTKAVDEKYMKAMTSDEPATKTLSHDVHANQSKAQQLEAKKARQFQEENPEREPSQLEKLDDQQ